MAIYTGDDNANTILTSSGNDTINTGGGNDWVVMYGGVDTADGGSGSDTLSFMDSGNGLKVDLRITTAQVTGFGTMTLVNFENMIGSNFTDVLIGNGLSNTIAGWGGDDTLDGLGGDDWLRGGLGNDKFLGGTGIDTASFQSTETNGIKVDLRIITAQNTNEGLDTFSGIENIYGSDKNDWFIGNALNNSLVGAGGNDRLNGREGNDILWGGAGLDTFVWNILFTGSDTIRDFVRGQDKIDINATTENTGWNMANLKVSTLAGDTVVTAVGYAHIKITLSGLHSLDASDFIF